MRVLLTGSSGQLGRALRASIPAKLAGEPVELIATARQPEPEQGIVGLDLSDPDACSSAVIAHQPDWVLNAGAYTAVDRAEAEPQLAQAVPNCPVTCELTSTDPFTPIFNFNEMNGDTIIRTQLPSLNGEIFNYSIECLSELSEV